VASGIANVVPLNEQLYNLPTLGIALDAAHVYWFEADLHSAGLDGSSPSLLSSPKGMGVSLATDGDALYWSLWGAQGVNRPAAASAIQIAAVTTVWPLDVLADELLAVDDANLYIAAKTQVLELPKDGRPMSVLASDPGLVSAVANDDTFVYWASLARGLMSGSIMRVPKAGGAPEVLAASQPLPQHIAVDAVSIFWADSGTRQDGSDGNVMRLAK
jgi:hypothetical protein